MLLLLVHFWWWEFWLGGVKVWTFSIYIFLIAFVFQLYLLTTLLFPDNIAEYESYAEYFMSGRMVLGPFAALSVLMRIDAHHLD